MASAMPVSRSVSPPQFTAFLACRTAMGPLSAMVAAISSARARACPAGPTWVPRRIPPHPQAGEPRQPAAAAHREALDRRDDRHRAVEHPRGGGLEDDVLGAPGLVGHALALLEVAPHAERLRSRPGQ